MATFNLKIVSRMGKLGRAIHELQEFQEIVDFREILRSRKASRLTKNLIKLNQQLKKTIDESKTPDAQIKKTISVLYSLLFPIIEEFTGKLTEAGKSKIYAIFFSAKNIQDVLDKFQIFCEELIQRQIVNLETARLDIAGGIRKFVTDLDIPE